MHSTIGGSLLDEEYHLYVLESIGARPSGAIRWTETWAHTLGPLIPLDAARCPLPAAARPGRPVAEARPTRPRRPGEGCGEPANEVKIAVPYTFDNETLAAAGQNTTGAKTPQ